MLRVARVVGSSMHPSLVDGDFVVALGRCLAGSARARDMVLVAHPTFGRIVKRVVSRDARGWFELKGDSTCSSSSATLGRLPPKALLGRVLLRVSRAGVSAVVRAHPR